MQRHPLRVVEQLGIRRAGCRTVTERVQLLSRPSRFEELSLVLRPLVLGLVEHADLHDRQLAQLAGQRELVANQLRHIRMEPQAALLGVEKHAH